MFGKNQPQFFVTRIHNEYLKITGHHSLFSVVNDIVNPRIFNYLDIQYSYASQINILLASPDMVKGIIRDVQYDEGLHRSILELSISQLEWLGYDPNRLSLKIDLFQGPFPTVISPRNFYTYVALSGFKLKDIEVKSGMMYKKYYTNWLCRFYWNNRKDYGLVYNNKLSIPNYISELFDGGIII